MANPQNKKFGPEIKISLSQYKQELDKIKQVDLRVGQTVRRLVNQIAKEIARLYEQIGDIYEDSFIDTSQGLSDLIEITDITTGILVSIQRPIENFLIGSQWVVSGQKEMPHTCQLPHHQNPPHALSRRAVVCKLNNVHQFCRFHYLERCVICGGELKYL